MPRSPLAPMIVYGNCQAEAITSTLTVDPVVSGLFRVAYYRSFDHPSEPHRFNYRGSARCDLLWEQHDPKPFPQRELLDEHVHVVRFPSVDSGLLWPFNTVNPYNAPEPPTFPFGRYAYGDRVIINAVNRGMNEDDVLDYYLNRWDEYKIDLERLLKLETARLENRDAQCDVQMGRFVLENFRKKRLFWTVNHPTNAALAELIERMLAASDAVQPALQDAGIAQTLVRHFGQRGPLGVVGIPIHPKVAEYFELEWYDPNERYRSWDGKTYSYMEYLQGLIRHSLRMREGGAIPTRAQ